jgi:metal-responsive CopG/Arc/MetJ family transcriptional regulator
MPNRHDTGWTSPANLALTMLSVRLPQESVDELDAASAASGLTKRQLIKQAIHEIAKQHLKQHRGAQPRTKAITPKGPV